VAFDELPFRSYKGDAMTMRISLTNNMTAEGVRWYVIERGKILRVGRANTELQARASAIKAIKEIEAERAFINLSSSVSSHRRG
jgi:hypothetical protein